MDNIEADDQFATTTTLHDIEKGEDIGFEDKGFFPVESMDGDCGGSRGGYFEPSGPCFNVTIPDALLHRCFSPSSSEVPITIVGALPDPSGQLQLTTANSEQESHHDIEDVDKSNLSIGNDALTFSDGGSADFDEKATGVYCQLKDAEPNTRIVNFENTTARRSKRLQQKPTSEVASSLMLSGQRECLSLIQVDFENTTVRRSKRLQQKPTSEVASSFMLSSQRECLSLIQGITVESLPFGLHRQRRERRNSISDQAVSEIGNITSFGDAGSSKITCISEKKNHGSAKLGSITQSKKRRKSCDSMEAYLKRHSVVDEDDSLDVKCGSDILDVDVYGFAAGLVCSICETGAASDYLLRCVGVGCFEVCHTFCLFPPLKELQEEWLCTDCKGDSFFLGKLRKDPRPIAKKIQRIVGRRQVNVEHKKNGMEDQFLIKWHELSHPNDSWVPLEWIYVIDPLRLHSYQKKCLFMKGTAVIDERKPEWFKIDRVIACRKKFKSDKSCDIWNLAQLDEEIKELEFLTKWVGLDYGDATWESSCTEELLNEIGRLVERHHRAVERADSFCLKASISRLDETPNYLGGGLLYDYQLEGLNWITSNFVARRNVILADEMGLGKTVQVVSFVQCMKQENLSCLPALIVAPKSILFHWEKEFRHWARELNVIIYQGEKQSRRCIQTHEFYSSGKRVLFDALVTNYEMVLSDSSVLKRFKWSAIIIDEAHKIKNLKCKLGSVLRQYNSEFRLLLTGTPLQNTLLELFALLHFLDPKEFFDPEYEAKSFSTIGQSVNSEVMVSQIHDLLRPRMLRRLKSGVLQECIPPKKWVEVPCALTDVQRDLYINILEKNYKKLNEGIQSGKKIVLNFVLMELKKCCNHPYLFPGQEVCQFSREATLRSLIAASGKLQLLEKLLPKLKENGNRVLIFSQMTKMLDILEDFLLFLGLAFFRIDGRTPLYSRQQQMKEFNNLECQVSIFLISTRAGGLGIDLPSADRVILYDPDFNPFMDLQAQSRAHRIGQTRPVVVYQLITKCTVEEKILEKSKRKLAIEHFIMNLSKKPTVKDLHSVLLHGARRILSRKKIQASAILYDDAAIDTLLKLAPAPGEKCTSDEDGYLGTIESLAGAMENEEPPPQSPKAEEWNAILGPVKKDLKDGDFGRGKRQKKVVSYVCDDESDSDEIYSPKSSSVEASSDDDSESQDVLDEM